MQSQFPILGPKQPSSFSMSVVMVPAIRVAHFHVPALREAIPAIRVAHFHVPALRETAAIGTLDPTKTPHISHYPATPL